MGGNGAFSPEIDRIEEYEYFDLGYRIRGHKILAEMDNPWHSSTPMNSNSKNPIYLCGKLVDKRSSVIMVNTIAVYENHKLIETIDLKFDRNGDYIPFSLNTKGVSHSHKWYDNENGVVWRDAHDKSNFNPIDKMYLSLIQDIVKFNKTRNKWKENE